MVGALGVPGQAVPSSMGGAVPTSGSNPLEAVVDSTHSTALVLESLAVSLKASPFLGLVILLAPPVPAAGLLAYLHYGSPDTRTSRVMADSFGDGDSGLRSFLQVVR